LTVFLNNLTQSELITRFSLANLYKYVLAAQSMQSRIVSNALPEQNIDGRTKMEIQK
jgi:hypothetical protein